MVKCTESLTTLLIIFQSQIFCKVKMTAFQQVKSWFQPTCTSCYSQTVKVEGQDTCTVCQRVVLYADDM